MSNFICPRHNIRFVHKKHKFEEPMLMAFDYKFYCPECVKEVCPECKSKDTDKVIAAGMPMRLCNVEGCHCLWGEPWATIYTWIVAPIEGLFNEGFSFMAYQGSYWEGLKAWWKDEDGAES